MSPLPINIGMGRGILSSLGSQVVEPDVLPPLLGNLKAFFRADGITGLSDGDPVTTWPDESGEGNDVTQATGAAKPTFRTGVINGLPIVRFDGVDDILVALVDAFQSGDFAGSVFAVWSLSALGTNPYVFASSDEASGTRQWSVRPNNNAGIPRFSVSQANADTQDLTEGDTVIGTGTVFLSMTRSSGTAYALRLNGADEVLNVISGANNGDWLADTSARDNISVGAHRFTSDTAFLPGDVAEVLYYDKELSGAETDLVEAYLATKYGLTLP